MHSFIKSPARLAWTVASLLALAALAFAPASARADFQFALDTANISSLGSGPFAEVVVVVNSATQATVTFTADTGYAFVDGSSLALNVNTGITSGSAVITASTTGIFEPLTSAGSSNVDGFGRFNVVYDQQDASNPATVESVVLTGSGFSTGTNNTSLATNTILGLRTARGRSPLPTSS
jgi:hypothetical protein